MNTTFKETSLNILFITEYLPSPKSNGGEIASSNYIAALQDLGHNVTVVGHKRSGNYYEKHEKWEIPISRMTIETAFANKWDILKWLLRSVIQSLPITSAKYINSKLINFIKRSKQYDFVIINHTQMFPLYRFFKKIPIVSATQNFESKVYFDNSKQATSIFKRILYYREGALLKKIERLVNKKANDIWALTPKDLEPFKHKGIVFKPFSFKNVVAQNEMDLLFDVGILGMWTWKPNLDSLEWFLREVVPHLDPSVKIAVGGKGFPKHLSVPENLNVHGFVNDTDLFFSQCRMIAVPALYDIGLQIKSIDALALGIPVIGTEMAFRHIEPLPESAHSVQNASAFANCIMTIIKNRRNLKNYNWNETRRQSFYSLLQSRIKVLLSQR